MDPETRAALAEQLLANELFKLLFSEQEAHAVEKMVYATDDETRQEGALRVLAIRSLQSDCERSLRSTRKRKAAPA